MIMSGVLEGGGQSAQADVMLGGHVSEDVRGGRLVGDPEGQAAAPLSDSLLPIQDFPARSGNRFTALLCIFHNVLLLLEDQFLFVCFTMSYTAMFSF